MERVLDSSVLVALFRENDTFHSLAKGIFMKEGSFLVPDHVLSETLTVLKMRESLEVAQHCAEFIFNSEDIVIYSVEQDEFLYAFDYFVNGDNRLSFIDTILFALSDYKGYEVHTFDKELEQVIMTA